MVGTKLGGAKASQTNKNRYGEDYYSRIGKIGGRNGHTGGFAYGDNGRKFGKIGGIVSRRARMIKPGDELNPDELEVLLSLGATALGTLRINGVITVSDEQAARVSLYESAARKGWEYIFQDCGVGPSIEIAWVAVLGKELAYYKDKVSSLTVTGGKLDDDENDRYRIIRNLVKALEVATGHKVK